jgi:ComF family protein
MLALLKEYTANVFDLFYPNICAACSQKLLKAETTICFRCENELPKTGHCHNPDNPLIKRFWGRVNLRGAAALYHFHKGSEVQHLLHQLKYKGRKDIGDYAGKILGHQLQHPASIIPRPDLILPVPLHWKKLKTRGYNQCDPFAQGISQVINVPFAIDALERTHENISQTKKKRFDRWSNVSQIFSVSKPELLRGKHILLVDDVVTTGATAEACLATILSVPGTTASFAAIAIASR